jgi:hypothetical protein
MSKILEKRKILQIGAVILTLTLLSVYLFGQEDIVEEVGYGTNIGIEIHVTMKHYRDGVLINEDHHAGVLTTIGKNWIEDQLGDSPSVNPADYISLSNSTSSPSSGWTDIPEEITTGGMSRAQGTYQNEGDGVWNITKAFSPTETNSSRLTGLNWGTGASELLASDTFTVINYQNGDTVTITWQITVT